MLSTPSDSKHTCLKLMENNATGELPATASLTEIRNMMRAPSQSGSDAGKLVAFLCRKMRQKRSRMTHSHSADATVLFIAELAFRTSLTSELPKRLLLECNDHNQDSVFASAGLESPAGFESPSADLPAKPPRPPLPPLPPRSSLPPRPRPRNPPRPRLPPSESLAPPL